jgi:hypothetical protein
MRVNLLTMMLGLMLAAAAHASEPDWRAIANQTSEALASAVGESSRGRPVAARLRSAIAACDRLLEAAPLSPRDRARVLHNRGVAHLELGDAGAAVLDLRRADALAPGVSATQRELAAARARVNKPATAADDPAAGAVATASDAVSLGDLAMRGWHALRRADIGGPVRWNVGLWALVGVSALLTARLLVRRASAARALGVAAGALFLVGSASFATLAIEYQNRVSENDVIVTAEGCTPRQGPDALAYPAARLNGRDTLPRGTELVVVETRGDSERPDVPVWLKVHERPTGVAAVTGSTVWVAAADVAWVRSRP